LGAFLLDLVRGTYKYTAKFLIPEIKLVKSLESIGYEGYHPRKSLIPEIKPKRGGGVPPPFT
jgi:hypothetical protein